MAVATALVIGSDMVSRLHRPFFGHVHSVFPQTINIEDSQGDLFSIRSTGGPVLNSLLVPPPGHPEGLNGLVRPGEAVANCGPFLLVFGGGQTAYSWRGARIWAGEEVPAVVPNQSRLEKNLLLLEELLKDRSGFGPLLSWLSGYLQGENRVGLRPFTQSGEAALPHILALCRAWRRQDRDSLVPSVKGLVGLGPGLTPAGDDFLAGWTAAVQVVNRPDSGWMELFSQALLSHARKATNLISYSMLRYAVLGQGPPGAVTLAAALAGGSGEDVLVAAQEVLAHGSTSGADQITGIAFGCWVAICDKQAGAWRGL
ncbi:MAG: DUF2877 domain-containing protein [Bacillota bacterium]